MTTENNDVGALLKELEPKTEFTEFTALWDGIKEARDRKVSRKAIYEKLVKNGSLSISYVTFTRFVKKMEDESQSPSKPVKRPGAVTGGNAVSQAAAMDQANSSNLDSEDKSSKVVTAAASALDATRAQQKGKDYSKLSKK
jgi:deoxyribodipyrimidine photolyase